MSHHLVEALDLWFAYPDGTQALRGASCRIVHGEAVGVVGANGAGKSTLLLPLNALLVPQRGTVRIGDLPVTAGTRAQIHRTVGFVFQDADDQLFMPTVLDDVAFGPLNLGLPAEAARARGHELGVRSVPVRGWQTALALWRLRLDSELVFVGDAGTTEANRPSRRQGVEWANYWTPWPGLAVLDLSYSRARFTDAAPEGDRIPGAIERTAALGVAFDDGGPWFGGLRLRYFGPRPLVEDGSVRSTASTILNARLGWRSGKRLELIVDAINLFDRRFNDIEYFYESQLRGESAPVADIHLHPGEPRTVRLSLRLNF